MGTLYFLSIEAIRTTNEKEIEQESIKSFNRAQDCGGHAVGGGPDDSLQRNPRDWAFARSTTARFGARDGSEHAGSIGDIDPAPGFVRGKGGVDDLLRLPTVVEAGHNRTIL